MIKPSEIKNQSFKKGLFGYKGSDVDTFVNTVYKAYEELYNENERLSTELEKSTEIVKESRVKIFELETQVQLGTGAPSAGTADAEKQAKKIIEDAKKEAEAIIAKAKGSAPKAEEPKKEEPKKVEPAPEPVKEEPAKEEKKSAASKFFKKAEEETTTVIDDDEIFVGEIEDNRKPNKMMIGDGEEEGDGDFEFL